MSNRQQRLAGARLYFVCAAQPDSLLHDALAGGVDIVQLRIKHGSDEEILTAARRFRAVCDEHGALLIINDRPDLAVAVGADGVHVGQDDISVAAARAAVGPERLVGLSTHTAAQVDAANQAGIDYIGVGPVHATPTKPGRPAVGLDLVRHAAVHSSVPFFAIGGVDPGTVAAVREAGARRVAVVRALSQARDPQATARELRATLSDPRTDAHAA